MKTGFGLTALILTIIALFIPLPIWLFTAWFALLLAVIAALAGDRIFTTAVVMLTIANTLLFSPVTLAVLTTSGDNLLLVVHIVAIILPFAAIILNVTGKLALGGEASTGRPDVQSGAHQMSEGRSADISRIPHSGAGDAGEQTWQAIKDGSDTGLFEEFIAQFPRHPRMMMAGLRLKELREKAPQTVLAEPSTSTEEAKSLETRVTSASNEGLAPAPPVEQGPPNSVLMESAAETGADSAEQEVFAAPDNTVSSAPAPEPKAGESWKFTLTFVVLSVIAACLVVGAWLLHRENERQQAVETAMEQQRTALEKANRMREAAEAEANRMRKALDEETSRMRKAAETETKRKQQAEFERLFREEQNRTKRDDVTQKPAHDPVPELVPDATAALTVSFDIVNNTNDIVNVAFFDRDNQSQIDPPLGSSYVLNGNSTQTYRISCTASQVICYGAKMQGNNMMQFWGTGHEGKQNCTDCCLTCPVSEPLTKTLNYWDSRKPAPSMTWKIIANTSRPISAAFYSKSRSQWGWPHWDQNWSTKEGENTFTFSCVEGEQICFGAWITNYVNGPYWGVGPYAKYGCTNCCGTCDGGTYYASLAD